jgi:hypothetical protein
MRLHSLRQFVLLTGCCCALAVATWAQDLKPTQQTTAMLVSAGGRVFFE